MPMTHESAPSDISKEDRYLVYRVEVMWPDTSEKGDGPRRWSTYSRWAFNDTRNPTQGDRSGSFEKENPDVSDVPQRLKGRWGDSVVFSTQAAAQAYAERLRQFGQPQCGWAGQEPWREKYRQPVDTRVVEVSHVEVHRVVSGGEGL